MLTTPMDARLSTLHAHYIRRINAAITANRWDLARDLADGFQEEALELMLAVEGDISSLPSVEILEIGAAWPRGGVCGILRRLGFWRRVGSSG